MKILSAKQIQASDAHTIQNEPIASVDLMERASSVFVDAFIEKIGAQPQSISVFCGTGNNGGDGLVIARMLHERGWNVHCFLVQFSDKVSNDNQQNQHRLAESGVEINIIRKAEELPTITDDFVLDALIGNGISRPLTGLLKTTVAHINTASTTVVSVDMPSGLYDRGDCTAHLNQLVHANHTFTFQCVKHNFIHPEYAEIVGNWQVLDIGLDQRFVDELPCSEFFIEAQKIQSILLTRKEHDHKGVYGHAGLICGSHGMVGAAVLSTKACLRSGSGLTTTIIPKIGYSILQSTCPEAICIWVGEDFIDGIPDVKKFTSLGIGPGLGVQKSTSLALQHIIKRASCPMVLDADALNLSTESDLGELPKGSILTPHPKEFSRLFGYTDNSHDQLELLKSKAKQHGLVILLKGRHSCVASPEGNLYFNSTGNPGMAKGGSGDVLTGLITGLLSRGYQSTEAAMIGCYLHGLAGDLAAEAIGQEGMTATDIVTHIPVAWMKIKRLDKQD